MIDYLAVLGSWRFIFQTAVELRSYQPAIIVTRISIPSSIAGILTMSKS